jgi:oxygen-independent coproporphyrinogen-3 oxidase
MILQLKKGYLDVGYFRTKFGVDILEEWQDAWGGYEAEGLATLDAGRNRIELTRQGLLRVDSMLPAFFEPQHQGVRYT